MLPLSQNLEWFLYNWMTNYSLKFKVIMWDNIKIITQSETCSKGQLRKKIFDLREILDFWKKNHQILLSVRLKSPYLQFNA